MQISWSSFLFLSFFLFFSFLFFLFFFLFFFFCFVLFCCLSRTPVHMQIWYLAYRALPITCESRNKIAQKWRPKITTSGKGTPPPPPPPTPPPTHTNTILRHQVRVPPSPHTHKHTHHHHYHSRLPQEAHIKQKSALQGSNSLKITRRFP